MQAHQPVDIRFGDVAFDPLSGDLRRDGQTHRLRPQSAAVLSHLLAHAGTVVWREDLMKAVWGEVLVTENSLAQCIAEIRRALGAERDAWLKTLARRGYQLDVSRAAPAEAAAEAAAEAPVTAGQPTAQADPARGPPAPAPTAPRPPAQRLRWRWLAASLTLLLLAVTAWTWRQGQPQPTSALSLAVMPFDVTGADTGSTWFAEVVGEDLTFNLARIPGARVIARASTQSFAARGVDTRAAAAQLGVRHLLTGSVDREGDRVTLRLQLVEASTGALQWGERIDTPLAELHAVERLVANRVANALHVKLVDDAAVSLRSQPPSHPQANDLALQAWAAWNRGSAADVARAHELAQKALALDDGSVLAWKTMASWHLRARVNQSLPAEQAEAGAEAAANRARAIDPDHPLVHTVWGAAQVLRGRYAAGIQALEYEIQTNPSHPVAYSYLGMAHLMTGEPRRAIQRYQEALAISPRDPRLSRFERHLALAYMHDTDTVTAMKHARLATQAPMVDRAAWAMLAAACAATGDAACQGEAVAALRKAWPGVSLAAVESEWPPETPAFHQQHADFVRSLGQALASP